MGREDSGIEGHEVTFDAKQEEEGRRWGGKGGGGGVRCGQRSMIGPRQGEN